MIEKTGVTDAMKKDIEKGIKQANKQFKTYSQKTFPKKEDAEPPVVSPILPVHWGASQLMLIFPMKKLMEEELAAKNKKDEK